MPKKHSFQFRNRLEWTCKNHRWLALFGYNSESLNLKFKLIKIWKWLQNVGTNFPWPRKHLSRMILHFRFSSGKQKFSIQIFSGK